MTRLILLSSILFAACGDDNTVTRPDAPMIDAPDEVDAAIDAPPGFVAPTPFSLAISGAGPDQIMSAAPGPSGTFYVAGFAAASPTGAKMVYVARVTATGALDMTFGFAGVFVSTMEFKGGTDEIDVAVQSDGKVVVSATIAHATVTADRDIGLFRVSSTGLLDATFGNTGTTPGYSRVSLSDAYDDGGTLKGLDASRSLSVGPSDQLFIHAATRNPAETTSFDTDFTVARLTALGILDTGYGTNGMTHVELTETDGVATAKSLAVLSDGSVIASGYAKTNTSNATAQPVLYKLTPTGARDNAFASMVFHEVVLTMQTEIYAFAIDGNKITTAGYGRESGTNNVWASLRFDATTGARATTGFGTTNGVAIVDPSAIATGTNTAGNNCRFALGLPNGKTALIGSTGASPNRDGAIAILTPTGTLDTAYGKGVHTFQLGGDDQFWGAAISGGNILVVGWKGFAAQTETANDNGYGLILPYQW
jgi:uncharacterized delta-60 repeat protein